jgi:predicted PurR-regulated permease PerM
MLYGLGRYFVPQLVRQGKSLVTQIQDLNANQVQNTLLAHTVGKWRFERTYGSPSDPRYQMGLQDYQAAGRNGEGLYQEFPKLYSKLRADFEANDRRARILNQRSFDPKGPLAMEQLQRWFLAVKAPKLFQEKSEFYLSVWEADHASPEQADELKTLETQPDFESRRDAEIRQRIWEDVTADPVLLTQLKNEWTHTLSSETWKSFRNSPQYKEEFKKFYEKLASQSPDLAPIDFEYFQTLAAAYPKGREAFVAAVRQHDATVNESPAHQRFDFESATKLQLGQQWWSTSHVADWVRDHAADEGPQLFEGILKRFNEGFGSVVRIPIQVATAVLLSFVMLIEWEGLKSGLIGLRDTRVRPIFDEVAPGIAALGKLIGKLFQGQVIISFYNACFMLIAMWFIGIEYKFILAVIVFVFSFIPVVGVVLSGFPICVIAVMQSGGSLMTVFAVVVSIAIIHAIEGIVLSPRIIGKIGHLHPVLVIVILLVGEHFFGMWGLVLGVPVAIYLLRIVILRAPIPGIYEPGQTSPQQELA